MQFKIRKQRASDQIQQGRQLNYRTAAAAPQSPHPQNQSQNQNERILFLPRAPQQEAGLDSMERIRASNQQVLKQDEARVR
jgi:peptidase E